MQKRTKKLQRITSKFTSKFTSKIGNEYKRIRCVHV